ncbi:MAG: hypothetical protein KBT44_05715 [Bacteroidales bacterium]|nr:hypothetical protein [Candidatus Equibacterium intestinale]
MEWVRHIRSVPTATTKLSTAEYMDLGIEYLAFDTHTVVSLLKNGDDRYLVMVNQNLKRTEELEIEFAKGLDVQIVEKDGSLIPAGKVITKKEPYYPLEPGDALILKIN